jgi:hypothetical protein
MREIVYEMRTSLILRSGEKSVCEMRIFLSLVP